MIHDLVSATVIFHCQSHDKTLMKMMSLRKGRLIDPVGTSRTNFSVVWLWYLK
ncbi:unnamed protein product [Brassica oleracea var. botrytis]